MGFHLPGGAQAPDPVPAPGRAPTSRGTVGVRSRFGAAVLGSRTMSWRLSISVDSGARSTTLPATAASGAGPRSHRTIRARSCSVLTGSTTQRHRRG